MKFRSLSALLALSAVSLSYAGGMLDAPKEVGAKSPVMTLGYRSANVSMTDVVTDNGFSDPDSQSGYTVGLSIPLVGPYSTGVYFTGFSSSSADFGELPTTATGALTSFGYYVGYDLPFGVMDSLSLTGKLIAENVNAQATALPTGGVDPVDRVTVTGNQYAVGFGLSGQYFMDAFGLDVGLSYLNPQGVRSLVSSAFSWNVSLAYKLS